MTGKWISQSKALVEYGLSVDVLNANIANVVHSGFNHDHGKTDENPKPMKLPTIKLMKDPQVPLTLRLVPNPRGYMYPMRLYNREQLKRLALLKGYNRKINEKRVIRPVMEKNLKKLRRQHEQEITKDVDPCIKIGHRFINIKDNLQECKICKIQVDVIDF